MLSKLGSHLQQIFPFPNTEIKTIQFIRILLIHILLNIFVDEN